MSFNEDWEKVKLEDIIDIQSGYPFKSKNLNSEGIGIPVIKIKNLTPPIISMDDIQYIKKDLVEELDCYELKYGDILISMTGSNVNQFSSAVGKVSRVQFKNKKFLLNQRIGKFELKNKNKLDYDFLYYVVSTDDFQYQLASGASGSANQANISISQIKSMKIKLPPLKEQKAIADILSAFDEKIELNNQINQTLEEMAQTIYKRWFVDFEPFQDEEFVDSELGKIPRGWEVATIGDVVKIQNGYAFKSKKLLDEGEIGVIKISNVKQKGVNIYDTQFISEENAEEVNKRYRILPNTILIALTGEVGRMGLVPDNNKKLYLNQRVGMLKPKLKNIKSYVYNALSTDYYKNIIESRSRGSVQKNIGASSIEKIKIILPPDNVLNDFSNLAGKILDEISCNLYEKNILNELRDTLLPKLMSGEIRVPIED